MAGVEEGRPRPPPARKCVDLSACSSDPRRMAEDVISFEEYSQPFMDLMASVPGGEKIVLVGHSFTGISLAFAMDVFPKRIVVIVIVTAILLATIIQQYKRGTRCPWRGHTDLASTCHIVVADDLPSSSAITSPALVQRAH
ncbi:Methylesterase 2 [Platanthera guangdongensis]|uniref:Methylesterase 2 n=1 Tax=Platanthera guangdongensis TaxID=2320717 RepID=A0ABR2LJD8_9ASPA